MNKEYATNRKKAGAGVVEASETILANLPPLICGLMLALTVMLDLFV